MKPWPLDLVVSNNSLVSSTTLANLVAMSHGKHKTNLFPLLFSMDNQLFLTPFFKRHKQVKRNRFVKRKEDSTINIHSLQGQPGSLSSNTSMSNLGRNNVFQVVSPLGKINKCSN